MTYEDVITNKEINNFIKAYSTKLFKNSTISSVMELQDFIQLVNIDIFKKIYTYNSKKSKLKTFIGIIINSRYKMEIRRITGVYRDSNLSRNNPSLDFRTNDEQTLHDLLIYEDEFKDYKLINLLIGKLDKERDKEILYLLNNGFNIASIQKLLKLKSRNSIYQSINRIKKIIKELNI